MIRVLLIFLIFPGLVLGITPGKWSHIDKYILETIQMDLLKKLLGIQMVKLFIQHRMNMILPES